MAGIKPGRTNGRGEIVNFFTPPKNVTLPADSYLSS